LAESCQPRGLHDSGLPYGGSRRVVHRLHRWYAIAWCPASVHEGQLCGRGRVGRKTWNDEGYNLLAEVHASILQQLQIVASYTTKHIEELRIDNEDKQVE